MLNVKNGTDSIKNCVQDRIRGDAEGGHGGLVLKKTLKF